MSTEQTSELAAAISRSGFSVAAEIDRARELLENLDTTDEATVTTCREAREALNEALKKLDHLCGHIVPIANEYAISRERQNDVQGIPPRA